MAGMPVSQDLFSQAEQILKKTFGYSHFHETQKTAITAVLSGKDAFVLMPTGGGKSLCYQVPALVLPGTAIIISPLIALMKDQVDALQANGVAAEFLNSSLESDEQERITELLLSKKLKLLYVSAERLISPEFSQLLKKVAVSLFAVDEAHCISAWGHDFRPDYTQLSHIKTRFPKVPIIALTATADHATRADILSQLELDEPEIIIDSFDRPNISLTVVPGENRVEKIAAFLDDKRTLSGIVYCLSRKQTEKLADSLQALGFTAACYHAGLSSAERTRIQKSFVRDKTQIICATIAFGMGIDKSNVRWVIHYNIPKNIEGYYQEIGRAGRDSAPAQALLFYTYADIEMIKKFSSSAGQSQLQLAKIERIKEYAEGVICRRKILLSYFGEHYPHDCQNCDICMEPFESLNGTALVKKVLQHIERAQKKGGGLTTAQLVQELVPTSTKVSFASWHFYVSQIKNLGLVAINFAHDQTLSLTEYGRTVLAEGREVRLVLLDTYIARQTVTKQSAPKKKKRAKKEYYANPVFEKLRKVRSELALKHSLAAYMIFSDATLLEMATEKPQNKEEMLAISGVGEVKWEKYGSYFLEVLLN